MFKLKQILSGAAKKHMGLGALCAIIFFLPTFALADYSIPFGTASSPSAKTTLSVDGTPDPQDGEQAWAYPFETVGVGYVSSFDICAAIAGTDSGLTYIALEGDNAGVPDGISIASGSIANNLLPTSPDIFTVTFDTPVLLSATTDYWVVVYEDSSGEDLQNCGDSGTGDPWQYFKLESGTWQWTSQTGIVYGELFLVDSAPSPTPTSTATTTTTINDPNRDFFLGIFLFFVGLFMMLYLFDKRR